MATTAKGERILVERSARLMATEVSVQISVEPGRREEAEQAADTVMAFMGNVARRLTRFDAESELVRLNAAGGEWFAASELLYACVKRALAAARASDGLFDPALLPQMEALGYDRDFSEIAHREIGAEDREDRQDRGTEVPMYGKRGLKPLGERDAGTGSKAQGWRGIELDEEHQRIRLPGGVRLDLGGIAKGWAADAAIGLQCMDFEGALINVGGDLRVRGGPQAGGGWVLGLRDPRGENGPAAVYPDLAAITFSRGGLATSGAVRRWWLRDGVRVHHLLDPRTGRPARVWTGEAEAAETKGHPLIATATALAPTAARAEVAAKVALLRGYPACLRAVESAWEVLGAAGVGEGVDGGVALALVLASGELMTSSNIGTWLASWGTEGAPLYFNASGGGGAAL